MGLFQVFCDSFPNFLEGTSGFNQFPVFFNQQFQFRSGGQGIQNEYPSVWVFFHIFLCGNAGCIITAGQVAGEGNAIHFLRIPKGLQPVSHAGAGRAGATLVFPQVCQHRSNIQCLAIHILLLIRQDFQRHGHKVSTIGLKQIGG